MLVTDDGAAYFVGTARRGEDGDVAKARRQPKPQRPKRMAKMDGKIVVESACNNGSSALVTASGHLYIFGKDSIHSEGTSGLIGELRDVRVTRVALGKAHVAALSSRGHVYTFGMNNKGQCGREVAAAREVAVGRGPLLCPAGRHAFLRESCMVCTVCLRCTEFGAQCVSSDRGERVPGT